MKSCKWVESKIREPLNQVHNVNSSVISSQLSRTNNKSMNPDQQSLSQTSQPTDWTLTNQSWTSQQADNAKD